MARRRSAKPQPPFARRLEETREAFGQLTSRPDLSKKAFAEMLGMEAEAYSRYERGQSYPPVPILKKIHDITGVSLDFLILGVEAPAARRLPPLRVVKR